MEEMMEKYLAILFFNQEYRNTSRYEKLPGVEKDRMELTELLSEYQQIPIENADNVLEELKYRIEELKEEKFKRVHFHFSGHGVYNRKVDVEYKTALDPHGECVVGTDYACTLSSVHDITLELLKLDTEQITMTLDCCRLVTRGAVVSLHDRGDISDEQHEKLFIFKAARDTRPVRDGQSFTRNLVSVCKESGGALPILDIEKKVNLKMRDQKCEAIRVLGGNANWEGFYWPQDVRVLDQKVLEMLQRLNLVEYEEVFKKQELSLNYIAEMNHDDLQSIGISSVKHRKAIINYIPADNILSEEPQTGGEARPEGGSTSAISIPSEGPQTRGEASSSSPDSGGDKLESGSVASCPPSPRQSGGEAEPGESTSASSTSTLGPQNGEEARPGEGSLQQLTAASVVLISTGPSAEVKGSCLGVFDYLRQYNKCPAYRQRHQPVANTQPNYLYRHYNGNWCVGKELGNSSIGLLNKTESDSVPNTNWLYSDGKKGPWLSDPELTVSTSIPSVCQVINISLHGAAARAQPRAGGEYRPTGEWSAGHPVFSNGDTYLCVRPGKAVWSVRDSPDSEYGVLKSGSVTWCPTSPEAAISHRDNISSWRYKEWHQWRGGKWRIGDICVTDSSSSSSSSS